MYISEAIKTVKHLSIGQLISQGSYSAVFLPSESWSSKNDNLLLLTTNYEKFIFQKKLFSMYGLNLETETPIEVSSGIYLYEVPKLIEIEFAFPSLVVDGFDHVSQKFNYDYVDVSHENEMGNSAYSFFCKYVGESFSGSFIGQIQSSISIAEYALIECGLHGVRWDLTECQFLYSKTGDLICVDPVIFDD